MAHNMEYQVLVGDEKELNKKLAQFASDGWKPILMSTVIPETGPHANQIVTTIILEREKDESASGVVLETPKSLPLLPPEE